MKKRNDLAVRAAAMAGAALIGSTVLTGCGNRTPDPSETGEVSGQSGSRESLLEKLLEFLPADNQNEDVYGPPPDNRTGEDSAADPNDDYDPSENKPEVVYGLPPEPAD